MRAHPDARSAILPMMRDSIEELIKVAEGVDSPEARNAIGYARGIISQLDTVLLYDGGFVPDEEIAAMYASGLSFEDVSAQTGVSVNRVHRCLQRMGVKPRHKGAIQHSWSRRWVSANPARLQMMIELRSQGKTLEEIAGEFSLTRERVRQLLNKAGVDTSLRPLTEQELAIVAEYVAGESLWTVAAAHGIGIHVLKGLITRAGYKVRPSPRSRKRSPATERKIKMAVQLYRDGVATHIIAERLGYPAREDGGHSGMIYRLLALGGVKPDRLPRRTPPIEREVQQAVWTDDNIMDLERLWANGLSARVIAGLMGVSRDAVLGKVRRLGLERKA